VTVDDGRVLKLPAYYQAQIGRMAFKRLTWLRA